MIPSKKIENFYLLAIKIVIFLIPLSALYISPSLVFPYITGKNFAFRILVEFAAVLWLGLIAVNKDYRIRNSSIVLAILAFTLIVGLADLSGVHPYKSFWSNYERMEGYITILHLALYFMIVKGILRNKKEWKILFCIFLLASALVSSFAYVLPLDESTLSFKRFAAEYGTRAFSTIGNPPFLASYLLFSIFIGFVLIINTHKTYLKIVYLLPIIFNTVVIYLTGSRGAILAGLAGIIMSLSLIFRGNLKKIGLLISICSVIAASAAFLTFHHSDLLKQDRTISRFTHVLSDPSVQSRIDVWKMALNGIKERPVLGWGQENFVGIYSVNQIPFAEPQIWMDRGHNIIIDWLVNAGILGLFAYLAIFISAFYCIWTVYHKQIIRKMEANILVTALFVYFIQNMFIFDTINTYLIYFTLLAYIDNLDLLERPLYSDSGDSIDSNKIVIKYFSATLSVLIIFSFVCYYLNYKPIRQCQLSLRASNSISEHNSIPVFLDEISDAQSFATFGNADLREIMVAASNFILLTGIVNVEGAFKLIKATTEQVAEGIVENRHDLEYLSEAISLYYRIAQFEPSFIDASEALIRECMRINAEYHWLYVTLADVYILKKDYESAFITLKKSVDLDPRNDKTQLKLSLAGIYTSREDIVNSSLENVKKLRMAKNNDIASGMEAVFSTAELRQIVKGYKEMKHYQRAIQYLEEIIDILSGQEWKRVSHRKARVHMEIARIYQALDDKENAAKEAKKAAALDPEYYRLIK